AQAHEDAPAGVESHRADIIDRAREEDQRPRFQCFAPRWRCLSDAPGPAVLLRNRPASAKRGLSSVRGGMSSAFTGRRGRTSWPTALAGMRRRPPSLTLGSCSRRRKRQTVLSETPSLRAASAGVSHRAAIESIPISLSNPIKHVPAPVTSTTSGASSCARRGARCPYRLSSLTLPCQGAGQGGTVAGA